LQIRLKETGSAPGIKIDTKMVILKRILTTLLIILILAAIAGIIFIRHISHRAVPDYNAEIAIKGLAEEVEVYRDGYGIPHIFASNEHDLYMATGYIHAQDRLWQMDLMRRLTTGRLSEIFGEDMITADQLFLSLRFDRKSAEILADLPVDISACLDAYSMGINAYIEENMDRLPFEFAVLGYKPEPWLPEHTCNLLGYFTWGLTTPWSVELLLFRIAQQTGNDKMMELLPDLELESPVYTQDWKALSTNRMASGPSDWGKPVQATGRMAAETSYRDGEALAFENNLLEGSLVAKELGLGVFEGSNNWAVSAKKSESGYPLIANDMHLQLDLAPGIWYQMHQVVEGRLNVTGVIFPGTPIIACGHNDSIAWGFTNVSVDDMDFYLETINPDDTNQYLFNGRWVDMEVVEETINIKGGYIVNRTNRYTHRGPVVSGFKKINDRIISMRWIGSEESNEFLAIYGYNRAHNWQDFTRAAVGQSTLSQNVVYGDVAGNIGMYTCAGIPIRRQGTGAFVVPGDTDLYDWTGRVPFEELPHIYNPEEGFVISANNKTVTDAYPYPVSNWFSLPGRYDRIRELLTEKDKLSAEDFMRIQTDQKSKWAQRFKDTLVASIEAAEKNNIEQEAFEIFRDWDCVMDVESSGALIFEALYQELVRSVFSDELGEELFSDFCGQELDDYAFEKVMAGQELSWCDDMTTQDTFENFSDMTVKSFHAAVSWLSDKYAQNPSRWKWGEAHQMSFAHVLSSVNILKKVFGLERGPYPVGGSYHTVCPYSYAYGSGFKANHGASERHVFASGNWDASQTVIPTGISGIPASDFFCNQSEMYVAKEYHPDYFSREKIVESAPYRSVFSPE
jgi:penicillin amidase